MTTVKIEVLRCDGLHGQDIYSRPGARVALLLDGWTTASSTLDYDNPTSQQHHFCPLCSVEIWTLRVCTLLSGRPWPTREPRQDEPPYDIIGLPALYAWDFFGDFKANVVERAIPRTMSVWRA